MRRLEAPADPAEHPGQKAAARQGKDLAGVPDDEPVKRSHQAKKANAGEEFSKHIAVAQHRGDRFRQGIVHRAQRTPVADPTGKDHDAQGEGDEGQHPPKVALRDGPLWIPGFLGYHSHAFNTQVKPDGKRKSGKNPA